MRISKINDNDNDNENRLKMNVKHEQMIESIRKMYYNYDPEEVCYINKMDGEGYKIEEIDGDYCHACATSKAKELDEECGGSCYHEVCVETMPENDHIAYCSDCGCMLNASLIVCELAEDDLDDCIEDVKKAEKWEDIAEELGWRLYCFFGEEETAKELFPKKMATLSRRLTLLFNRKNS